ncbi:26S proteasome regulatory subunit [Haematococcus lacustris]|uniref:26S proteasome regulatory subunit n=1 Tax=Haematococcus lacustris TaxID=44745 RepID=A0A699ZQ49_HAELA|nr:26S proteasome regulatory subunit [Haematococcus lacustris]
MVGRDREEGADTICGKGGQGRCRRQCETPLSFVLRVEFFTVVFGGVLAVHLQLPRSLHGEGWSGGGVLVTCQISVSNPVAPCRGRGGAMDGTEKAQKVFVSVPTEVGQTEAEEIGG